MTVNDEIEATFKILGSKQIIKNKLLIGIESNSLSIADWMLINKKVNHFLVCTLQEYENRATIWIKRYKI